jgi:hypothetical protein
VPVGGSLAGDDENELPAAEEVEDPDLPVPVEEEPADDAEVPVAIEASEPPPPDAFAPVETSEPLPADAFAPIEASEPPPAEDAFAAFAAAEPPPAEDGFSPFLVSDPAPAEEAAAASQGLLVPGEHRVAVHTRGGSTKRGVVRDVDLSQPAFALEPAGGGDGESVQHDDVKAIFFMLAPGASAQPGGHGRVKVTFADGRTIEGERDGTEDKNGFFLVPQDAARTNTWRIYIAREATAEIRDL